MHTAGAQTKGTSEGYLWCSIVTTGTNPTAECDSQEDGGESVPFELAEWPGSVQVHPGLRPGDLLSRPLGLIARPPEGLSFRLTLSKSADQEKPIWSKLGREGSGTLAQRVNS
jgi:hypothetical protein